MTWYIRKSVSVGPVRFNLSKSGIGTSVGVTGFRVGVRPNGSSYIHAGRYGLYYREELGGGSVNKKHFISERDQIDSDYSKTIYSTATSKELRPVSRKELLSKLNKSYKSLRFDYICGIIFLIFSTSQYSQNVRLGIVLLVVGILTTVVVAIWESRRRTVSIIYDFEDENAKKFKGIISAFNNLASNRKVWTLVDSRKIYGSHESKLNAGASSLINKSTVKVGEGKPPWVNTNINVPVLNARSQTLYMMPDGILVYDNKGVGFVDYNDISLKYDTTNFIEESPPSDAEIIYYTWKYPNRDGGPDRRFNNNHQIPVCLYGKLKIKSSSGLFLYLMTSKGDSSSKFVNEFNKLKLGSRGNY